MHGTKRLARVLLLLVGGLAAGQAQASWLTENLIDPVDGQLDASKYLAEKKGFLPVPIVITEPAVGYGFGIAALFLHDPLAGKVEPGREFEPNPDVDGKLKPPSASVLVLGGTENDTWFAAGGHFGVWKDDRIRYTGALGRASVNMKFFGLDGGDGVVGNRPLDFNTEATFLLQQLLFRWRDSNLFAGLKYLHLDTENTFRTSSLLPGLGIPDIRFGTTSAGLGLVLLYDGLDNPISPGRGIKAGLEAMDHGETWGGDDEFAKYRLYMQFWQPLGEKWLLALRGDMAAIDGDAPFYEYPFVDLRGIPAMRYQGERTLVGEVEVRYDITPRWSVLGFAGVGRADSNVRGTTNNSVDAQGVGFRYLVARRFGMRAGIDVAWGPEERAFYIQVGSAWGR